MGNTRLFHIADILSVTHGYLISTRHMDGVYDVLNYVTGQNLMTHQLLRAADEARAAILAQMPPFPQALERIILKGLINTYKQNHPENWLELLIAHLEDTYGQMFPLHPVDTYRADCPIEEARDMVSDPSKVIEVKSDDFDEG